MDIKHYTSLTHSLLHLWALTFIILTTVSCRSRYNENARPNRFTDLKNWAKEHHHDNREIVHHIVSGRFSLANLSEALLHGVSPEVQDVSEECRDDVRAILLSDSLIRCK